MAMTAKTRGEIVYIINVDYYNLYSVNFNLNYKTLNIWPVSEIGLISYLLNFFFDRSEVWLTRFLPPDQKFFPGSLKVHLLIFFF